MFRQLLLFALVAAAFGACRNPLLPEDVSDTYADGWAAGCDTGHDDMHREDRVGLGRKNVVRYQSEPDYTAGWDDGYAYCADEQYRQPFLDHGS